jgi:hypothetical protein
VATRLQAERLNESGKQTLKAGAAPAMMLQNTQYSPPEDPLPPAAQGDAERTASASAAAAVPWRSAVARRVAARGASRHGRKWERSTARRRSGAGADEPGGGGIWVRRGGGGGWRAGGRAAGGLWS